MEIISRLEVPFHIEAWSAETFLILLWLACSVAVGKALILDSATVLAFSPNCFLLAFHSTHSFSTTRSPYILLFPTERIPFGSDWPEWVAAEEEVPSFLIALREMVWSSQSVRGGDVELVAKKLMKSSMHRCTRLIRVDCPLICTYIWYTRMQIRTIQNWACPVGNFVVFC